MLLVLDNCEHVIEAAAALAVDTLGGGPGVRVLATSRERYAPRANTCTVCHRYRASLQASLCSATGSRAAANSIVSGKFRPIFHSEPAFRCRGSQLPRRLFVKRAAATMNKFELTILSGF